MSNLFTLGDPYKIIYADPPWQFNNKRTGGTFISGAASKYPVMNVKDIMALPVPKITDDNCVLCMWWVGTHSEEANAVAKAWGFKVVTMTGFVWVKRTVLDKPHFGMGKWTRAGAENCLIGVKGNPKRASAAVRSVYTGPIEEHSKKPAIFRDKIVQLCGDLRSVELFARQETIGWDVFGNEVQNSILL